MGFWSDDVKCGLDRMFDFNRDGKIDMFERAMQYEFLEEEARIFSDDEEDED